MEPSPLLPPRSESCAASRPSSLLPDTPAKGGRVIDLAAYRPSFAKSRRDVALDAQWDTFVKLVKDAWCWRDPESLAAVETCVAILKAEAAADWER